MTCSALRQPPCDCPGPGWCERYKKFQSGRCFDICKAKVLTVEKCEKYRQNWAEKASGRQPKPESVFIDPGGPGVRLVSLLHLIGLTDSGKCGCKSYAAKMNRWGVVGCTKKIDEIVDKLEDSAKKQGVFFWRHGARWLVRLAIWQAEHGSEEIPADQVTEETSPHIIAGLLRKQKTGWPQGCESWANYKEAERMKE